MKKGYRMKNIMVVFNFLISSVLSLAVNTGIGDLEITVDLKPATGTKKYYIENSILLDAGDFNSKSSFIRKKIADVTVLMQTKQTGIKEGEVDYCIVEGGDFAVGYRINDFQNLEKEITTSDLKKYYGGESINLKLYQENFRVLRKVIKQNDQSSNKYYFSAYPEKCYKAENSKNLNTVSMLEYSFEIWIDIKGARAGDIVKKDVTVGSTGNTNEDAIGAIKDLIKDQFDELAK